MANEKRLIDANALLKKMQNWNTKERLINCVEDATTVDAVEVVHGEWCEYYETFVDDGGAESFQIQTGYVCSECGVDGSAFWRYCPYCGAKMDGDGNA